MKAKLAKIREEEERRKSSVIGEKYRGCFLDS
jgi:hypothetical protein